MLHLVQYLVYVSSIVVCTIIPLQVQQVQHVHIVAMFKTIKRGRVLGRKSFWYKEKLVPYAQNRTFLFKWSILN